MTERHSSHPGVVVKSRIQDGTLILRSTQDVEPILDAVRALPDVVKKDSGHARRRLLGSIPVTIAYEWSLECGAAVGTQEWLAYAKRKLATPDYAHLRVFKA